jgi:hypothetical protein
MKVFNLISDRFPDVVIDIFVQEPFAFDAEYRMATIREVAPHVRFCSRIKLYIYEGDCLKKGDERREAAENDQRPEMETIGGSLKAGQAFAGGGSG